MKIKNIFLIADNYIEMFQPKMSDFIYMIYQCTSGIEYPEIVFFLTQEGASFVKDVLLNDEKYAFELNPKHDTFSCNYIIYKFRVMNMPVYIFINKINESKIIVL